MEETFAGVFCRPLCKEHKIKPTKGACALYDLYDRKIEENGVFLLGYCQRKTCGKVMPPFLYTTLRMIRVLTGSAVWRIGERDFRMEKGDIAAVNNIEPRRFVDFSEDFSYSLFAFTPSVFSRYTSCLSFFCDRRENFVPIFGKSEAHFDDMTYLFTLSAKALSGNSSDGANRTLVFSLLTALVALMAENRRESLYEKPVSGTAVHTIFDTVRYIHAHKTDDLTVTALARRASMSEKHFSEQFFRYTGMHLSRFVNSVRAAYAAELLRSDAEMTVLEAAMRSGFGSSSGFYKAFETVFGMPPTKYALSGGNREA